MDDKVEGINMRSEAMTEQSKTLMLIGSFKTEREILGKFSPKEQETIQYRQQVLSSLAYFIGKDFRIPITLGLPTPKNPSGWQYVVDMEDGSQFIQANAEDLLKLPLERSRFRMCHEAGHKRISRMDLISLEEWNELGFSSLMNGIEDPRSNNFITESYPKVRGDMIYEYESQEAETQIAAMEAGAKQALGHIPRFMQATFEYIKQWFGEVQGKQTIFSDDLPEEVRNVVCVTLDAARNAWLTYPSREEANQSDEIIRNYAKASYQTVREKIWPEFKKLVDQDRTDQEVQQTLKDMQGQDKGKKESGVPQPLKDQLTDAEKQELEQALENAMNGTPLQAEPGQGQPHPIDLDSLSKGLKQKLQDYIDSLPEDVKRELAEKAKQAIEDYQKELDGYLEGKLSDNPEKKAKRVSTKTREEGKKLKPDETATPYDPALYEEQQRQFRDMAEQARKRDETIYDQTRQEVLPIIDELENDLRDIFVKRQANQWHGGFRSGKKVDIIRRIQEKAKGISAVESRAWERRDLPNEKDYAITMLVDLSGSMEEGQKIDETFKAAIVLAEVLNRLSIKTEIIGFNDRIYEYQSFGQPMSKDIRDKMGGMLQEVSDTSDTGRARWNDDGWALQQASARLAKQREATEKFLLVLSDGQPVESPMHPRSQYELRKVINRILSETDQKLIGLGLGKGTEHVSMYYPNSVANIGVAEMAGKLADVIREAIANYDIF